MQHIVIVGNGIAGITAARHIRKLSNDQITVISGETEHFFSRTALMYIYMGHMKYEHTKPYEDWFWKKNKITLRKAWIRSVDFEKKTLNLDNKDILSYDTLILATGSKSNMFGWPGQDLAGVQGLYSYQDLQRMEENTREIKRAVIVGGGLIGVEMAEMLHSRHIPVTYLIREKHFWGNVLPKDEGRIVDHHLLHHEIDIHYQTELAEILDDGNGRVRGIKTNNNQIIECQFVGLAVGVHPNLDLVENTSIETDKGILVDEFLQTNLDDVYAIGDCAQLRNPLPHRKAIEPVWYVGRMMGETVARTITGNKTQYRPGVWFNSAKFFDIEYQTYGFVPVFAREGIASFYWENHTKSQCMKISYDRSSMAIKGVNLLGIRSKHELWDRWIREERKLPDVIRELPKANFDPEFHKRWEKEIQLKFNEEHPELQISVKKRGLWKNIFSRV